MSNSQQHALRSTGTFLLVCAALCGLIAYERFQSALRTGREIARHLHLELQTVQVPAATYVASFLGVLLLVAGAKCLWHAHHDLERDPLSKPLQK